MIEIKHKYTGAVLFTHPGADLDGANLRYADLHGANLRGADLRRADLRYANLHGADLRGADLHGADLRGADLRYANLDGADLRGAKGLDVFTVAAPEGALIGWKKCRNGVLVKLAIPADARRVNAIGSRKCRAEFADVLEVIGADFGKGIHDPEFFYAPGARVVPRSYDPDNRVECSGGIHFFITRGEAEAYS